MDMVDLVIMVCAVADPTACTEKHMLFESHGSLQQCMMEAPPYLAQWVDAHPDVKVTRWHCAWPEREDGKS
jgi:hypothetical protein